MAIRGVHHLVLRVDDVPESQAYYRELFGMEVLFREGGFDGEPGTVPDGVTWDEAIAAGATPYTSFLGRDAFVLGLGTAESERASERLDHVALAVDEPTFEGITNRAEELGCEVRRTAGHHRLVTDRYGIEWELNTRSRPPRPAFEPLDL